MSMSDPDEFDVIRLADGREGTVVEVYRVPDLPLAYEVEFDEGETETVKPENIKEIIWKAKN